MCSSDLGSKPAADLRWFRNEEEIKGTRGLLKRVEEGWRTGWRCGGGGVGVPSGGAMMVPTTVWMVGLHTWSPQVNVFLGAPWIIDFSRAQKCPPPNGCIFPSLISSSICYPSLPLSSLFSVSLSSNFRPLTRHALCLSHISLFPHSVSFILMTVSRGANARSLCGLYEPSLFIGLATSSFPGDLVSSASLLLQNGNMFKSVKRQVN